MKSCSVIIPSRNRFSELRQCLRSLLKQNISKESFEIIVIDDANSDPQYERIRNHRAVDLYIRNNEKKGPGICRNIGLKHASGKIILFCDDDTILPENWVSGWINFFEQNRCDAAAGRIVPYNPQNDFERWCADQKYSWKPVVEERLMHIITANAAFTASVLKESEGFDSRYAFAGEDMDITRRMLDAGKNILYNADSFVWHRQKSTLYEVLKTFYLYGVGNMEFSLCHDRLHEKRLSTGKRIDGAKKDYRRRQEKYGLSDALKFTLYDCVKYGAYYGGFAAALLKWTLNGKR